LELDGRIELKMSGNNERVIEDQFNIDISKLLMETDLAFLTRSKAWMYCENVDEW